MCIRDRPTTVGKRATLWAQEFLMDLDEVEYRLSRARLLGSKGTTGTQASFLELFEGDHEKCRLLDQKIAEKMGYASCFLSLIHIGACLENGTAGERMLKNCAVQ